jgi:hypothetical protein
MNTSKILAISLLLVSPLALARVQLNTTMQIKGLANVANRTITTEVQLDKNVSAEIYSSDDMRIDAELIDEKDETATIGFTIYAKNENGDFEKISEPVLVPAYGQDATLAIGSTEGDSISIVTNATRI